MTEEEKNIETKRQKRGMILKEHSGFIFNVIATYGIGIALIAMQYEVSDKEITFFEMFLDSIIPTTVTYILGCILLNIGEMTDKNFNEYWITGITVICLIIYLLFFCVYCHKGFSLGWFVCGFLATAGMIWLNVRCYIEKCMRDKQRSLV